MSNVRVIYQPSNVSPEEARNIRARVWAYVFDCYAKKNAAGAGHTGDDKKEGSKDDFLVTDILP